MKIGWAIPQGGIEPKESLRFAARCEELDFDSVWVYDHLMPYWLQGKPSLEGWTLLAAVAARTTRIRVGTLVTNVTLRNVGHLAKAAATVDRISNGRLTLGLGTGDKLSRGELWSFGYRHLPWHRRLRILELSIEALRKIWSGKETHVDDENLRFRGISRPTPVAKIPIWIGGKHPALGRIATQHADGWNLWGISLSEMDSRMHSARSKIATPDRFEFSWAGTLSRKAKTKRPLELTIDLGGKPDQVSRQLKFIRKIGMSHIIFYPERGHEPYLLEWFAEQVRPLVGDK